VLSLAACPLGSAAALAAQQAKQVELTAGDRMVLERLALGRARARMQRLVRLLPFADGQSLGAWLAGHPSIDRSMRVWTRARTATQRPRFYTDGVCEVDVTVAPAELAQALRELFKEDAAPADAADIVRRAARQWPYLWSTGAAAVSERAHTRKPVGWEDVTIDGMALARRAAIDDALDQLIASAGRLKLGESRMLSVFIDASAAVTKAVRDGIAREVTISTQLAPDQTAEAAATLTLDSLVRVLTEAHTAYYRGDRFSASDFRALKRSAAPREFKVTGLGLPPADHVIRRGFHPLELDAPDWASRALHTTGIWTDDFRTAAPLPPDQRIVFARLIGMDALRQQVESLVIQKDVTVERFLLFHPELKGDVLTAITAARPVTDPQPTPDGGISIEIELPLRRIWDTVKRGMRRVELDEPPSETAP
jgi:hypothetical protein